MKINKAYFILISQLLVLNLILRLPWFPHEIGWDSFTIHSLANSLSSFGEARWWIHPLSIVGNYPYSYASALPFFLSGLSQLTGLDVEKTIFLYGIVSGLLSVFFIYILAGVIWDNEIFKILVAIIFSTSQGIVTFTTWTANARTLFVLILPVFIYLLLNIQLKNKIKFTFLTFSVLILLVTTHKLYYYTIPLLVSFIGLFLIYRLRFLADKLRFIPYNRFYGMISLFFIILFLLSFGIGFFNRSLIEADPRASGTRYAWLLHMFTGYTRYLGIVIILVFSGYLYLAWKKERNFQVNYLLFSAAAIAPLLYNLTYTKWFIPTFASLYIGFSLYNLGSIEKIKSKHSKFLQRTKLIILMFFIVSSIVFTSYFQFLHFLNEPTKKARYMQDATYQGGKWVEAYIDGNLIGESYIKHRVHSVSGSRFLTGFGPSDLAYEYVDPTLLEIEQVYWPNQLDYYVKDPFVAPNLKDTDWVTYNILKEHWAKRLIRQYSVDYYVSYTVYLHEIDNIAEQEYNDLYNNGRIKIWEVT